MDSPYAQFRATRVFGALDALRALSILAVIWHHAEGAACPLSLGQHGFLGVDMFFAISGFLIVTLLLREREAHGTIDLGRFYVRRALRIFPVYYALLFMLTVVLGVLKPDASLAGPFFEKLPYYLTYTSNWLPDLTLLAITWSLATEEQFYLVWPPLEKHFRRNVLLGLLGAFVIVNQCVNFQCGVEYWPTWLVSARQHLEILQITFTPICLGVLLAHALHDPRSFAWIRRCTSLPGSQLAAMVILLVCASCSGDISGWPRLGVQLAMTGLLATCVIREDHGLCPLTGFAPLKRIGVVSYGMYLYHPFVLHVTHAITARLGVDMPGLTFVLCTLGTYFVSEVSYRYYETAFLQLKDRLHGARGTLAKQA
ncbi:MAG: acyltransferase [Planctomycetaceae bacterium]|nr:acyltransferase [Planctomycetaceae bacterium]